MTGGAIVGALVCAVLPPGTLSMIFGFLAVVFAMINVVGGYLVTDRMLEMFKHKKGGK